MSRRGQILGGAGGDPENGLQVSLAQGLTSWGAEKEPQMSKNSAKPPWGLCPDPGSSGGKSRSPP